MTQEQVRMYTMLAECYGMNAALEAYSEYEFADAYHVLPSGARYLEALEAVTDSGGDRSYIYVWRDPAELRAQ